VERFVEAAYPPEAEAQKLEGRVVLSIDISASGEVTRAEVVEPAGHGFDEAALAAIRQFRFTPAELDGQPSPVRITYAYDFVLRPAPTQVQVKQEGPVNFTGRVLERGNRKPLAGPRRRSRPGVERPPDERGQFSFRDLPPGSLQVIITASEFQRFETTERIDPGQQTRATYHVLRTFFSPYETVVRARGRRRRSARPPSRSRRSSASPAPPATR
jgi:TonB family protein